MNIQMIALNQLVPSSANVRKTGAKIEIEPLAASIKAHGLLQNLQVRETEKNKYEVVAGGRRLAALKLLVKQKELSPKSEIECAVLGDEDAQEISLAENLMRLPMHPADQYEAFKGMIDTGKGIEEIAARFGTTATVVKQRLKLASVSPKLIALYKKDEMSLDQLMALAITDDHKAQEAAWNDCPDWQKEPETLRGILTSAQIEADDKRVLFVGLEAYQKAGGSIFRDLFQPEHEGYLTDTALLSRLIAEKMESEAVAIRAEGWKWVQVAPDCSYSDLQSFLHISADDQALSQEQQEERDRLQDEYDRLESENEDNDEPSEELEAIGQKLERFDETSKAWLPEDIAQAGAILTIDRDGELKIIRGLVKQEDKKAYLASKKGEGAGSEKKKDPASQYPASLVEDLTAHKTAALRAILQNNVSVALVCVAHALALPVLYPNSFEAEPCLELSLKSENLARRAKNFETSRAYKKAETEEVKWYGLIPEEAPDLFPWLLNQNQETVTALIAYCAAQSVNVVRGRQDRPEALRLVHGDELAAALGLNMAEWWKPTKESYFGRVSKKLSLAAVTEAVSPEAADNLSTLKKDVLATQAEERLAGKGWLPAFLRAPQEQFVA